MTNIRKLTRYLAGAGLAAMIAGGASAQEFDLSGTEVTIGTAQAQVLNLGTLRYRLAQRGRDPVRPVAWCGCGGVRRTHIDDALCGRLDPRY